MSVTQIFILAKNSYWFFFIILHCKLHILSSALPAREIFMKSLIVHSWCLSIDEHRSHMGLYSVSFWSEHEVCSGCSHKHTDTSADVTFSLKHHWNLTSGEVCIVIWLNRENQHDDSYTSAKRNSTKVDLKVFLWEYRVPVY